MREAVDLAQAAGRDREPGFNFWHDCGSLVGAVRSVEPEGSGRRIWIDAPPDLLRYAVEKGSIAVQGTSLTVAASDEAGFAVALIPHTLAVTTLGDLEPGHGVNLEVDVLAKYVERLLIGTA